jgi:isopenicillin N synthase-like dioxygenase
MPDILKRQNNWPDPSVAPTYRSNLVKYQQAMLALARRFVRIFALALHLSEDYFDGMVTYPITGVRCLHYPPMTGSDDQETGIGAHTDIECMFMSSPL